jgi:antitoxin CcdA
MIYAYLMRSHDAHKMAFRRHLMRRVYDRKAPKQATNLSVNSDLLRVARESGVNLSAVMEEALVYKVAAAKREAWVRENSDAIAAYNDFIEDNGVYSDSSRSF